MSPLQCPAASGNVIGTLSPWLMQLEAIKLSKEAEMRAKHEQQKRREKEAKELRERQNSEKKKQMHSHHVELTKRVKGATSKISDLIKYVCRACVASSFPSPEATGRFCCTLSVSLVCLSAHWTVDS